jgi:YD repeat-containing protein
LAPDGTRVFTTYLGGSDTDQSSDVAVDGRGNIYTYRLDHLDGAGNIIWQRDALGRWTKTEYDALGRPVRMIVNYEDGDPLSGALDADIVSATDYDALGRVSGQVENYVDGLFVATEPITDRITLYQYDTLNWQVSTTRNEDPASLGSRGDTNRTSVAAYAPGTNRVTGQRDALGRWTHQQYDALGRHTLTILNCRDEQDKAVPQGCAPFDPATPDRNVPFQIRYDLLGRPFKIVDALGQVSRTTFDGLGRTLATTQNSIAGGPTTASENVYSARLRSGLFTTTHSSAYRRRESRFTKSPISTRAQYNHS